MLEPTAFDPATYDGRTLIAFPGDPRSAAAAAYLASTARPTGAGYLTWLSAHGYPKPRLRLVAMGAASVLPPSLDHDHGHRHGWLPHAPLVVVG